VDAVTAYVISAPAGSPDLAALARLMRGIVDRPEEATAIGLRARDDVLSRHAPAAGASFLRERFDHAQQVLAARSAAGIRRTAGAPYRLPPSLAEFAGSRADPRSPSRFPVVSRPLRRLVARLTAHGDTHRAVVDRRLAEALLQVEARLDEMDRRLRVSAGTLDQPGPVPAQLAALEERTLDRLSRLDARLQRLDDGLGERPDRLAQTVEPLGGYHRPPAGGAPAFDAGVSARGQELGGGDFAGQSGDATRQKDMSDPLLPVTNPQPSPTSARQSRLVGSVANGSPPPQSAPGSDASNGTPEAEIAPPVAKRSRALLQEPRATP